jgi:hypothetical protein
VPGNTSDLGSFAEQVRGGAVVVKVEGEEEEIAADFEVRWTSQRPKALGSGGEPITFVRMEWQIDLAFKMDCPELWARSDAGEG